MALNHYFMAQQFVWKLAELVKVNHIGDVK